MTAAVFLAAATEARRLLDHPDVERRWLDPSALARMTIGALCAHLSRAVTLIPRYLEIDGQPPLRDAPDYFLRLMAKPEDDLDDDLAVAVRIRAESEAEDGVHVVTRGWDDAIRRLEAGLETGSMTRAIAVRGSSMTVADYLVTRLVELVIHSDDLAASIGTDPPDFSSEAMSEVTGCLVEIARRRSSSLALIRFMSRRERSQDDPFRVF